MARGRGSRRVRGVVPSDIRAMTRACEAAGGVNLGQGVCDLPTHPLVKAGAIDAIEANLATYSSYEGIAPLRRAVAKKLASYNKIAADPDREILITVGSTGAFALALLATLDPGDGIVLFEPFYSYHLNTAHLVEASPRFVTLRGDGFTFDLAELDRAAAGARVLVLCTPGNPAGKVFTRAEIETIAEIAIRHDLLLVTDEIYEYILFDGREHLSPAALPALRDRTLTISGFSKTFSVTGWRLGYVSGPADVIASMAPLNDLLYVCPPTPLQHGALRGMEVGPDYYDALRADYQELRDLMAQGLAAAGMRPILPQGAYYMLADHRPLGLGTARQAADTVLARVGVASIPGSAFYSDPKDGDHLLRFCFAKEKPALADANRRLSRLRAL